MVKDIRVTRNRGFIRILAICSYLSQCNSPKRARDIMQAINAMTMYNFIERTVRRDLLLLAKSGVVQKSNKKEGKVPHYIFKWNGLENIDCVGFIADLSDEDEAD